MLTVIFLFEPYSTALLICSICDGVAPLGIPTSRTLLLISLPLTTSPPQDAPLKLDN